MGQSTFQVQRLVFFDVDAPAEAQPHGHRAQWGIVVDGEVDPTGGDETRTHPKGDSDDIPSGAVHSARFRARARVIDFFAEPSRYRARQP